MKCQAFGCFNWRSQWPIPGSGTSITTHLEHALRKQRGKSVTDHVADVVGDESDFLESKLIQNCGEVPSLRDLFVTAFGMGRQAHASQVGNDDCVIFNEDFRERHPHIASVAEAMEK